MADHGRRSVGRSVGRPFTAGHPSEPIYIWSARHCNTHTQQYMFARLNSLPLIKWPHARTQLHRDCAAAHAESDLSRLKSACSTDRLHHRVPSAPDRPPARPWRKRALHITANCSLSLSLSLSSAASATGNVRSADSFAANSMTSDNRIRKLFV